ncbi:hypothetical protein CYG68_18560 [Morganella morganii]|uniref:Uncharacterized protein n=1 Tax=Morganella morganii TaxID=582 RepID=A0A8I0Q536_MORMO|nr:hypothetical protein [Morganella morganii]
MIWIDEASFLKITKIRWITYYNARLGNNNIGGTELPPIKGDRHNGGVKMALDDVIHFLADYNDAEK